MTKSFIYARYERYESFEESGAPSNIFVGYYRLLSVETATLRNEALRERVQGLKEGRGRRRRKEEERGRISARIHVRAAGSVTPR